MPSRRALLLAGAAALGGCASTPAPARPPRPPTVDELASAYEALMAEHGLAEWSRYAGQPADVPTDMASLRAREAAVIADLAAACRRDGSRLDPREIELWLRAERGLQLLGDASSVSLADRLEQLLNEFAFEVNRTRVSRADLRKLARSDDPDERLSAHRAWVTLHREAAPLARQLLQRRAEIARTARLEGGFYGALLELRGLSIERLRSLLGQLDERTRPAYLDTLVEIRKASGSALRLHDVDWMIRKLGSLPEERFPATDALPFARSVWSALGVDLDRPRVRIDVRDFAFGGQTISVRVPDDVRTVVSPTAGSRFYATLLHELGHAFASTRSREARPVFKGYEWIPGLTEPAYDEGVAEIFGRLLDEPAVLSSHLPSLSAEERARFLHLRARAELVSLRSRMLWVVFERSALEDPDQDLDGLWKKLHRDLLGVEDADGTGVTWATSPFLATYPVYTQSYVLAAMVSCQVRASLREQLGASWLTPAAGARLAETLVADGARSRLDDKMRRLTGAPLSIEAYARWLSSG